MIILSSILGVEAKYIFPENFMITQRQPLIETYIIIITIITIIIIIINDNRQMIIDKFIRVVKNECNL